MSQNKQNKSLLSYQLVLLDQQVQVAFLIQQIQIRFLNESQKSKIATIEKKKNSPYKINLMNQTKNLDIALIEAGNSEKALIVQEKEVEMRRKMMKVDAKNKRETNKIFTKVLDKFIDKKETSQDVFILLKS